LRCAPRIKVLPHAPGLRSRSSVRPWLSCLSPHLFSWPHHDYGFCLFISRRSFIRAVGGKREGGIHVSWVSPYSPPAPLFDSYHGAKAERRRSITRSLSLSLSRTRTRTALPLGLAVASLAERYRRHTAEVTGRQLPGSLAPIRGRARGFASTTRERDR